MASSLTSPTSTPPEDPNLRLWNSSEADAEFLTPHLLLQLEDDLERSRMREAGWISLAVHLLVVLMLVNTTRLFPGLRGPIIASPADLMKNQQLTYLDLPPDLQKEPVKPPPDTKTLSDKNRQAMSRHPQLDKKTLEELRKAGPPQPPPSPPPGQQAQNSAPAPQGGGGQPSQQQGQQQQMATNQPMLQDPRLAVPQQGSPKGAVPDFRSMMTPGQQISQAANSVAMGRSAPGAGFGGAVPGDYGAGKGGAARVQGNLEVLSDTQGVDFGPYLSRVLQAVRMNWYAIIPEAARAPLLKKGKVSIEFVILPDGKVAGMKLIGPSGDVSLDRAAWGGITGSDPFAPLPKEFHGPYLALRFHFYYNPSKGDIE